MNNTEYFSSINDVSAQLGVPAHTLRYWEKQFPVAIRPTTGAGNRRYYRAETVDRLKVIKELLYGHGMTIAGVKKLIRDGNLPENVADIWPAKGAMPRWETVSEVQEAVDTRHVSEINQVMALLKRASEILNG